MMNEVPIAIDEDTASANPIYLSPGETEDIISSEPLISLSVRQWGGISHVLVRYSSRERRRTYLFWKTRERELRIDERKEVNHLMGRDLSSSTSGVCGIRFD